MVPYACVFYKGLGRKYQSSAADAVVVNALPCEHGPVSSRRSGECGASALQHLVNFTAQMVDCDPPPRLRSADRMEEEEKQMKRSIP